MYTPTGSCFSSPKASGRGPTVVLGISAILILPSRPEDTSILNAKERKIALERRNTAGGRKEDIGRMAQRAHNISSFKGWKVYCAGVVHFAEDCATGSMTAFLPTTSGHTACFIEGVGYVLLLTVSLYNVRYFAIFCITAGTYTAIGLVLA
ncbi:hypothetical protein C8Q74DRAFT_1214130 [Fomes fomentarius]|nr:hypothetical protein C8Q74DRAFT_1214130 [Fomes fomentarius]